MRDGVSLLGDWCISCLVQLGQTKEAAVEEEIMRLVPFFRFQKDRRAIIRSRRRLFQCGLQIGEAFGLLFEVDKCNVAVMVDTRRDNRDIKAAVLFITQVIFDQASNGGLCLLLIAGFEVTGPSNERLRTLRTARCRCLLSPRR